MKENVGKEDRTLRSILGPALMAAGYKYLDGGKGQLPGFAATVMGSVILESAITKVCPLNASLGIDTRKKRTTLSRIKHALSKGLKTQKKQFNLPGWAGGNSRKESAPVTRMKGMYLANALISGPIGLANLVAPKTMKRLMGMPEGDPIQYGIASGAIPLAFGLAGLMGLRSPRRLSPVLGLQVIYKSLFLLGTLIPLAKKKGVPLYAAPVIGTYVLFLAGDLIARPFSYMLSSPSE